MLYYNHKGQGNEPYKETNMASFFVVDDDGVQVSDERLGMINDFNTFKQAENACKRISKKYVGRFSVQVAISTVLYENGIDLME